MPASSLFGTWFQSSSSGSSRFGDHDHHSPEIPVSTTASSSYLERPDVKVFTTSPKKQQQAAVVEEGEGKRVWDPINGKTVLVYLIRHGEASHNILEKAAMRRAKQQAEEQGLSEADCQERMEQARVAVLCDETLRDAVLSEQGRQDALKARARLDELTRTLPSPTKVLVSPLTRTLETADRIFPHHDQVHVREELQERQTGKPCDCRRPSATLTKSFRRFCMDSLRENSSSNLADAIHENEEVLEDTSNSTSSHDDHSENDDDDEEDNCAAAISKHSRRWKSECLNDRPHILRTQSEWEEDRASLRMRTKKLLGLLDESTIAIVGHKGYFRELERGTLGDPTAKEMSNGEVRVYRLCLFSDNTLHTAERIA